MIVNKKKDHLKAFKQQAKIQPRPQPNAADAVKVIQLYGKYSKLVKDVRARLNQTVPLNPDRALAIVRETDLPPETILKALRAVSGDPQADLVQLTAGGIGTARIAQAITEREMPGVDFKKVSFRKHCAWGKKLLNE